MSTGVSSLRRQEIMFASRHSLPSWDSAGWRKHSSCHCCGAHVMCKHCMSGAYADGLQRFLFAKQHHQCICNVATSNLVCKAALSDACMIACADPYEPRSCLTCQSPCHGSSLDHSHSLSTTISVYLSLLLIPATRVFYFCQNPKREAFNACPCEFPAAL